MNAELADSGLKWWLKRLATARWKLCVLARQARRQCTTQRSTAGAGKVTLFETGVADVSTEPTTAVREYTREEMRQACRDNYNSAIEKAAAECDRHAAWLKKYAHGGEWNHARVDEATCNANRIRMLAIRGSDDGAGQSAGWGWE